MSESDDVPIVQVLFSRLFKRQVRELAKRYRQIQSDLVPIIEQIQSGDFVGDRISSTSYLVIKVRIKNSDISTEEIEEVIAEFFDAD
jgi:mRNA-degrading endonuclease RelE of RelBE toxin-antitoxin system